MSTSNKLIYVIALVVLFAAGLLADKYAPWKGQPKADPGYANLGGDFTLDSAAGKVQLQDFRGQLVLMYFGFTSCPEICPTALSGMASSMRQLTPELEAQVQPLFVSVDPARDSLDNLAKYSAYFHPRMLGLTSDIDTLDLLVKQYGAYYTYLTLENSALEYTVDHTSRVYLIGREGELISAIAHGTSVADITTLIEQHL